MLVAWRGREVAGDAADDDGVGQVAALEINIRQEVFVQ